ncbi:hypothetical protein LHP98_01005 [Rhodobacter sp. Har01]|uniref:hypothetical protein n=1 Tax=Rhodobacter sp. Har01 TaxID=2883999 RepID=UPI001D08354A|nr:hypothetical protein [Rhodobacter sp. Har01]MCB6176705.1 hypothetical protein [Rhodobacter sp. Har01]
MRIRQAILSGLGAAVCATGALAEVPEGWISFDMAGVVYALPPDWAQVEDGDRLDGFMKGDPSVPSGLGFGIGLDDDGQEYLDEVTATPAAVVTLDGVAFDRWTFTADSDGMKGEGEVYVSTDPLDDGDRLVLLLSALNTPFAEGATDYAAILATLDLPEAGRAEPAPETGAADPAPATATEAGAALGGVLAVSLPEGWYRLGDDVAEQLVLMPVSAQGTVTLARGQAAQALATEAPAGATAFDGELLGQKARVTSWDGSLAEFSDGVTFRPGSYRLYQLATCLPGDEPLAVLVGGVEAFHNGTELKAVLAGLTLTLPSGSAACPAAAAAPKTAAAKPAAVAEPAPEPAPELAPEPAAEPQPVAEAPAPALGTPPPPPPDQGEPAWAEDSITASSEGWSLYQNGRYGTFIEYPSSYFTPDALPTNGDGRSFASVDGQARFYVFAQWNVLALDEAGLIAEDKKLMPDAQITYERAGPGWYVLSGLKGADIFYRRVLVEWPDGLVRVFEISYPQARAAEFDATVTYMSQSFGPGTSPGSPMDDGAAGSVSGGVTLGELFTPPRGTADRSAILDAARVPVESLLGRKVLFQISVLRTDGAWAYLQATPLAPGGGPFDWSRTPYAQDWANDMMSDVIMVLLTNDGSGWVALDTIVGPTDVAWYGWTDSYGLPEALFLP